ncbi:hypothetical protein LSAT2_029169 [Lamellibrachia satsuma]|nr:hypothetical protein LSAT2_029169 [Lamellibrachia satsuma]
MLYGTTGNTASWVQGTIDLQIGPVSYTVRLEDGIIVRHHIDQLQGKLSSHQVADEMFSSTSRKGANKILWVFSDGEYDISSAVGKLKQQGITVFSVGIGSPPNGWMSTAERENTIMSVAKDRYHYACAKDWTSIIGNVIRNDEGIDADDNERALYVPDDTYTKGECSSCPSLKRCVCNVHDRRYTCTRDRIGLTPEERGTVDERCRDWNRRPQGQGQGFRSSYVPVVLRIV